MSTSNMKILLADDDADDRMFFEEALEAARIKTEIVSVNDGMELMEYLNDNPSYQPHILFLDINMPRKNGIEALKEIRKDDARKDLVVAIYSTSSAQSDIEETFILGANIYIKKPNDFNELKKVLEDVVSINWQFHTSGLNKETFLLNI